MPSLQDLVNVKFRDSFISLCNWTSDVCSLINATTLTLKEYIGRNTLIYDIKSFICNQEQSVQCRKKSLNVHLKEKFFLLPKNRGNFKALKETSFQLSVAVQSYWVVLLRDRITELTTVLQSLTFSGRSSVFWEHISPGPVNKVDGTWCKFPFITSSSKSSIGYSFRCSGQKTILRNAG